MFAVRAAVVAPAQPARKRRACGRAFTRSGARPRRAVGDETDAWMTRDMPPPLLDAPHALGDARDDPAATTSETRVPSEDAETVASSLRSTDAEDESSRRETTETATETTASDDDDDELSFVRNAKRARARPGAFLARPPFEPFEFVDASLRRPRSTQAASERHRGARRGRVAGGPGGESRESARARQKRRVSTVLRRVRGLADAPGRHARRGGRHGAIRDDSRLDRLRDAFRGRRRGSIAIGDVSRQSRVWRFRRWPNRELRRLPPGLRRRRAGVSVRPRAVRRALPVLSVGRGGALPAARRGRASLCRRARRGHHRRQRLGAVRRDPRLRRRARRGRRRQPATRGSRGALQRRR